jgi:hypothetical protein
MVEAYGLDRFLTAIKTPEHETRRLGYDTDLVEPRRRRGGGDQSSGVIRGNDQAELEVLAIIERVI